MTDQTLHQRGTVVRRRTPRRISNKATVALLVGLVALVFAELSPVAVAFGSVALRDISFDPALGGRRMAIAGIVLGIVGLLIAVSAGDLDYLLRW